MIFLDMVMQMIFPFSIGFILPFIEMHLGQFGVTGTMVGLCISLNTVFYAIVSILCHSALQKVDSRFTMTFGVLLAAVAFLLIGPWEAIFPKDLLCIVIGQCLLGTAGALIQSNF